MAILTSARLWFGTSLALAGAALLAAWWLADRRAPEPPPGADRPVAVREPAPPGASAHGAGDEGAPEVAGPVAEATDEGEPELDVLVLDAATAEPIAGASVVALADSAGAREAGVALPEDAVGRTETDGRGGGRLRFDEDRPPARLVARAAGYRAGSAGPPLARGTTHEIRLAPGLEIAGVAVDRAGEPVAGVEVHGEHAGLPRTEDSPGLPPVPGREADVSRTDEWGEFRLRGLSPGTHRLSVRADGWILDPSVHGSTLRRPRRLHAVHARAGDPHVRIVLVPIRMFRLRLLSAVSGRPVSPSVLAIDVTTSPGAPPTSLLSYADEEPIGHRSDAPPRPVLREDAEPGAFEGYVILEDAAEDPVRGEASIEANGYLSARSPVTLRRPSELEAVPPPDDVRLVPEDPAASGTLVVDCAREAGSLWRPETRILSGCRLSDERRFHARGFRRHEDRWEFTDLPVGESRVQVFDGLSHSLPVRTTVPETGEAFASVRFPAPTGVTLLLRDEQGRRLFDAELVLVLSAGQDRGGIDLSHLTRLRPGTAGPLEVLHPLSPGPYRFAVAKRGVGEAAGEVVVAPEEVVRIQAVLRPRESRAPASERER